LGTENVRVLAICAIIVAALYIITLHPYSGIVGGLFFVFLIGWTAPSLLNILLTGWCVLFIKGGRLIRVLCFVPVSFVLGINTSFPVLITRLAHTPEISSKVHRAVKIDEHTKINFWLHQNRILVAADPLSSPFDAQGDEGCGCMYFVFNGSGNYLSQLDFFIRQLIPFRSIMEINPSVMPPSLAGGVHFNVQLVQDLQTRDTANLSFDVYDGAEKTASFSQRGIPYDSSVERRIGRERRLLNGYFLQNSSSMLLHDNFWTYLLRDFVSYIPRTSVKDFLAQAVPNT
jgi:hypothetical protein